MMTLPVAFLLGLMAGSAVAWIARVPLREAKQPLRTRYGTVVAFFGVVLMVSAVAFFVVEPAWALMYLVHPDHAFLIAWPMVTLGILIGPSIGLKLGHLLVGRGQTYWWLGTVPLAGGLLATLLTGMSRLGTVDYYEVFHYGSLTTPLTASAILIPVLVTSVVVPMLFAFCLVQVQRHAALIESVPQSPRFPTSEPDAPPLESP